MISSPSLCRSCGDEHLELILSLGATPLANALRSAEQLNEPEETFPLELALCRSCSLVQLTRAVPPEKMFSDYPYFSSFSDAMVEHARKLAARLSAERKLNSDSLVVEAASNDGYLLRHYQQSGVPVLGIEPARNIAAAAEKAGVRTRCEFFGIDSARRLVGEGMKADVFHAHNVLAHVPDLNGFVAGVAVLLKPTGVAILEFPYLKDLLDHCEFDTIYHEHLCYFSLTAIERCLARHGLVVADVERVPIHGGSLRLSVAPLGGEPTAAVAALRNEEARWGVDQPSAYLSFARQVGEVRTRLRTMLGAMKAAGKRIAAYGASAKGSTLLNWCGIGRETLDFVADRSTVKQGRYTPGTGLPIVAPERLEEDMPDAVLLLTWNFADEIRRQQAGYIARGGKFIVPIPMPKVA